MRLIVDFSDLHAAVRKMGAAELEPDFELHLGAGSIDRIDIDLRQGKEVVLEEVDTESGLLSYKGRQVLLYIQDHGKRVQAVLENGSNGNKYHVAFCATLDEMRSRGRFERYVATNDMGGRFRISGVDPHRQVPIEGEAELRVCKNCLDHLNYQGYQRGNRGAIFSRFSLEEFFATYSSLFPHMPSRMAGGNDSVYTEDWPDISRRYKADRLFRCESCGVDLANHRQLLHTHHKNGVKTDNRTSNLEALCADCHRRQPAHDGMFVRHEDMQLITRLRREQMSGDNHSNWEEVFELADPAVQGILHHCRARRLAPPEVGYELRESDGRIVGQLELAWPSKKAGVAISEDDLLVAREQGWRALPMLEALGKLRN
jgi:hypothetical protein